MMKRGTFKADQLEPVLHTCGGRENRSFVTGMITCQKCGEVYDDGEAALWAAHWKETRN